MILTLSETRITPTAARTIFPLATLDYVRQEFPCVRPVAYYDASAYSATRHLIPTHRERFRDRHPALRTFVDNHDIPLRQGSPS